MGILGWSIVVGLVLAVAVGIVIYRRRQPPDEGPTLHFNCERCRQRIGYRKRQIGNKGMCPRCGLRFFFPPQKVVNE